MDNSQKLEAYFQQIQQRVQAVQQRLPELVGNIVINHTLDNFRNESFDGKPWPKRKSKKDQSRQLLVKSGRLRRSPRVLASSPRSVIVGSDVPYAAIHNNGGDIRHPGSTAPLAFKQYRRGPRAGRTLFARNNSTASFARMVSRGPYIISMPQRRFLGTNPALVTGLKDGIRGEFKKEFENLKINIK